ncbi:MAG: DMT family transporter [Azospirillaceae bacterium]
MSTAAMSPAVPDRALLGTGLAALAFFLFTSMDAGIKVLTQSYPLPQVIALNALWGVIPLAIFARRRGGWSILRSRRPWVHVARSAIAMSGAIAGVYAFSTLPLAQVYIIIFSAPLLITALSVPILGEQVGWRRWSAVLVGFIGVLIVLRPTADGLSWGMLGALGGAFCFSLGMLLVRRFGREERSLTFSFYILAPQAVVYGLVALPGWQAMTLEHWALSAVSGLLGGIAALTATTAFRIAPSAMVAPFQYTQLIWGTLYGWLIWRDMPDGLVALGGAVIIASGLYILHREVVLGRQMRRAVIR